MSKLPCYRCGLCCIVAPCFPPDERGCCPYLAVHEKPLTTSCTNNQVLTNCLDTGCTLRINQQLYDLYKEFYQLDKRKKQILEVS